MFVIALWVIFTAPPRSPGGLGNKEPERGGPSLVVLKNSEKLSKQLLPKQFDVAKTAIDTFVKKYYGETSTVATIVGNSDLGESGTITLKIQVDNSSSNMFGAVIDKWSSYDKLIFSVPSKSYSVSLPVYTN